MQHTITPAESWGKLPATTKSETPDLRTSNVLHTQEKNICHPKDILELYIYLYTLEPIKEGTTNPPNGTNIQCRYKEKMCLSKPWIKHINTDNNKKPTKVADRLANIQRFCFTRHPFPYIYLQFQLIKLYIIHTERKKMLGSFNR